jgi:hypothetical protein
VKTSKRANGTKKSKIFDARQIQSIRKKLHLTPLLNGPKTNNEASTVKDGNKHMHTKTKQRKSDNSNIK